MKFTDLGKKEAEFLNIYKGLDSESKRLVKYVARIGASNIFSVQEYKDFLELLKNNERDKNINIKSGNIIISTVLMLMIMLLLIGCGGETNLVNAESMDSLNERNT